MALPQSAMSELLGAIRAGGDLDVAPEIGVTSVDRPVELATTPARDDLEADVEHRGDAPQAGQGDGVQVAALDQRHERSRDAGAARDVLLAPVASQPDGPESGAHPFVLHRRAPYGRRLIAGFVLAD